MADGVVSVAGLKATPQRDGYVRYAKIGGDWATGGVGIRLDYSAWIEHQQSPLWIVSGGESTAFLRPILKKIATENSLQLVDSRNTMMLPLEVLPGEEFSDIVGCAVKRITNIWQLILEQVAAQKAQEAKN